jgi:hypothetical protein
MVVRALAQGRRRDKRLEGGHRLLNRRPGVVRPSYKADAQSLMTATATETAATKTEMKRQLETLSSRSK